MPRDHPLSNVRALDEILLDETQTGSTIPRRSTCIRSARARSSAGAATPRDAPPTLEDELRAVGPEMADAWPAFDLVFLGMGGDGHLLSVFPGSAAFDSVEWTMAIPAPTHIEPHVERVTMHPAIVGAGRATLMVSTGESKAEILATVLGRGAGSPALAGPARPPRPRDLDPRRGRRQPPPMTEPARLIPSTDGTPIAVFRSGTPSGPPLLLIHGTTADHTTFRTVGPMLGTTYDVTRWTAAVAATPATRSPTRSSASSRTSPRSPARWRPIDGSPIDVVGHSYGGRTRPRRRAA